MNIRDQQVSWRPETLAAGPTDEATERGPEIPPPSDLVVTRRTADSVLLSWRDNSRVEQGFWIERGEGFRNIRWNVNGIRYENPVTADIEGKGTRSVLLDDEPQDKIVLCYRVRAYRFVQTSKPSRRRCAAVSP